MTAGPTCVPGFLDGTAMLSHQTADDRQRFLPLPLGLRTKALSTDPSPWFVCVAARYVTAPGNSSGWSPVPEHG